VPLLVLLVGAGCAAKPRPERPPSAWCNVDVPSHASRLQLPPTQVVAGPAGAAVPRWLIVWATWCEPCEREWPRIDRARALLASHAVDARPTLLSIDNDAAAVTAYLRAHPTRAASAARILRSSSADDFAAWARELGLASAESGLPFHLLTAPDGRLTCIHAGPLLDEDIASVIRLLDAGGPLSSPAPREQEERGE
jgi:thiol-disulfide isomerase/thioredoxin